MLTVNQPLSQTPIIQTHIRSCTSSVCQFMSCLFWLSFKYLEVKRSFLHTLHRRYEPRLWMARRSTYSAERLFQRIRTRYCLRMPLHHWVVQLPFIPSHSCSLRQHLSGFFLGSPAWCSHATVWGAGTSLDSLNRIPAWLGLPCWAGQVWFLWRCSNRQCRLSATPHWYMIYPRLACPLRYIHTLVSSCNCGWTILCYTDGWVGFCQRLALPLPQHETLISTYCS